MSSNFRQFERQLQSFAKDLLPKELVYFHTKIAFAILSGVVVRTPVDTGRARGGWQTSINVPKDEDIERFDKTGNRAITEGRRELKRLRAFEIVWISNNVFYVPYLEDGTPKMAPRGMVKLTIQDLSEKFK